MQDVLERPRDGRARKRLFDEPECRFSTLHADEPMKRRKTNNLHDAHRSDILEQPRGELSRKRPFCEVDRCFPARRADEVTKRRRARKLHYAQRSDIDQIVSLTRACRITSREGVNSNDQADLSKPFEAPTFTIPKRELFRDDADVTAATDKFQALLLEYDPAEDKQQQLLSYRVKAPGMRLRTPKHFPSRLMKLPGEIRNRIYRLALCEESEIAIDATNHQEPGLLRTSRQIRRETLLIYRYENKFRSTITNFKLEPHLGHWSWHMPYTRVFVGRKSRSNIIDFVKQCWQSKLLLCRFVPMQMIVPPPSRLGGVGIQTLRFALRIVADLKEGVVPWDTVQKVLDSYMTAISWEARFTWDL